jgi:hypothetical protein
MKIRKFLFYSLAALLGGCIPVMSLHPLYTEKDVVFEEGLLGTWLNDPNNPESFWKFEHTEKPKSDDSSPDEKAYKLTLCDEEGNKGLFIAHLVKLDDKLFLDAYPGESPWEPKEPNEVDLLFNNMFLLPTHTFMKVDSIEPELKMRLTLESKMEELLKENPNAVEHTKVEDRLVLTASTKELQAFVLKYADNENLFADEMVLNRKAAGDPNVTDSVKPENSEEKKTDK